MTNFGPLMKRREGGSCHPLFHNKDGRLGPPAWPAEGQGSFVQLTPVQRKDWILKKGRQFHRRLWYRPQRHQSIRLPTPTPEKVINRIPGYVDRCAMSEGM